MSLLTNVLKLWRTGQYLLPADSGFMTKHLFAAGQLGLWLDPINRSTLWQDDTTASPVSAGEQAVGRIAGYNGVFASQATSGYRAKVSARVNLLLAVATLATQSVGVDAGNYLLSFTGAGSVTLSGAATGTKSAGDHAIACTAGSLTLTVSGPVNNAFLRMASQANLPFQDITAPPDYDAEGFPFYLLFDGANDYYTCATGGGGADGVYFAAALRPLSAGATRTLFSDANGNAGYIAGINAANKLEIAAGNGSAWTTVATAGTADQAEASIVQVWDDGTNLSAQIGNGSVATVARPVVAAGTAGFTLLRDNGAATGYFNGQVYGAIYRKGPAPTQDERDAMVALLTQKARFA